ncbi:MAG: DUF4268 domain-containing protein [Geminicoccaceae bacterium]
MTDFRTTTLGHLDRVDLRDIWTSEARDFTPWLAREENLQILGDTLGIDLELEAQEKAVGPFRADILCKDIGTDAWVLVENQLERTDHGHLGQLLTYASGLSAVTIVWIAAHFTEEHRSTLDWLNKITDESFRFFGLELELWRIGDSPAAPKFNIVSKPNDWSRSVAQAVRAIDETELSETRATQQAYWSTFQHVLNETAGPVLGNRKPWPRSWIAYPIGRSVFNLNAAMTRSKNRIRAELYIRGDDAKAFFHLLQEQKEAIESEYGYPLEWEELPARQDSRIAVYMNSADPEDEKDWSRQHDWLATKLNDLHRVFADRVRALDADEWQADLEDDTTPSLSNAI